MAVTVLILVHSVIRLLVLNLTLTLALGAIKRFANNLRLLHPLAGLFSPVKGILYSVLCAVTGSRSSSSIADR